MHHWLSALLVIAMTVWIAGVLYKSQLLVRHCDAHPGSIQLKTYEMKERRLGSIITLAMVVSLILAVWLEWRASSPGFKIACVLFLTLAIDFFQRWVRDFANDQSRRTKTFYQIAIPLCVLLMVAIVILSAV